MAKILKNLEDIFWFDHFFNNNLFPAILFKHVNTPNSHVLCLFQTWSIIAITVMYHVKELKAVGGTIMYLLVF